MSFYEEYKNNNGIALYSLTFKGIESNVEFQFENTICGGPGKWLDGACDDKRWYPRFTKGNPNLK